LQLEELLQRHREVFDTTPGHTGIIQHQITTGETKPLFHPPYIVVFSESWKDHLLHLDDILTRLKEVGLKAKSSKCTLAENYCSYLGHRVGDGKIEMEEAKLEALRNFNRPKTKKDIRAFLGLAGYYRRFIPHFAERTARLSDLTKKDAPARIEWNKALEQDFHGLKELMCTKPTLHCQVIARSLYSTRMHQNEVSVQC